MSLTTDTGLTPADIAACTGNCGNNGNGMWGGDGAWLIILFFIFAWGWGGFGNGFGGNGGGMNGAAAQGALTREQACIDNNFNNLMRETAAISDAVNLGFANSNSTLCNFAYEQLGQSAATNSAIQQGFNATNVAMLQGFNAIQSQAADCCCKTQSGIEGLKYTIASEDCNTRSTIQNGIRDVLENQNANARAVLDKLTQQEIASKDAQIATLNQQLFRADLAASQQAQNNYLVNTLRPCPQPAYITCSPFQSSYGIGLNNSGCGCGCNGYAA